ncbi:unnamed protein product [Nesidiocoris tenuis]|uniref:Uncharacterized protein n=1 Tax=Nesidiocoris tenuis TaxID=355587 RepID=A0A6H5HRR0_9HEMI|nr:unnamed protein product [Nesidiocoris tenuis]
MEKVGRKGENMLMRFRMVGLLCQYASLATRANFRPTIAPFGHHIERSWPRVAVDQNFWQQSVIARCQSASIAADSNAQKPQKTDDLAGTASADFPGPTALQCEQRANRLS